ncbi:MAG: hypothetical protein ABSD73_12335 [Candidatus Bathyarchaeia archaeon]
MADAEVNGSSAMKVARGLGVAMTLIIDSQIYPFMLSSAFTARTIVQEKGQVSEVQKDLNYAFALSVLATALVAYFIKGDWLIALFGVGFSVLLYEIYLWRGNIPFDITAW